MTTPSIEASRAAISMGVGIAMAIEVRSASANVVNEKCILLVDRFEILVYVSWSACACAVVLNSDAN